MLSSFIINAQRKIHNFCSMKPVPESPRPNVCGQCPIKDVVGGFIFYAAAILAPVYFTLK